MLQPGDIVKIVGLISLVAKEHNGKEVVLGEYISHEDGDHAGRWRVTIVGTDKSLAVKRANLQFMRVDQGQGQGKGQGQGPQPDPRSDPCSGSWSGFPQPSAWAMGLSIDEQYEWLCDCFRMRMDALLFGWGGAPRHHGP